jgi:hypothetical protein
MFRMSRPPASPVLPALLFAALATPWIACSSESANPADEQDTSGPDTTGGDTVSPELDTDPADATDVPTDTPQPPDTDVTAPDAEPDVAPDVEPDAEPDVESDADPDVAPDAEPDAELDVAPDAVEPDADAGDSADTTDTSDTTDAADATDATDPTDTSDPTDTEDTTDTVDPCLGVECPQPADGCVEGTDLLRTYAAPGVCVDGACDYDAVIDDTDCNLDGGTCTDDDGCVPLGPLLPAGALQITEFFASAVVDSSIGYFEVSNPSTRAVSLEGVTLVFSADIGVTEFEFPEGVIIPPLGSLVISQNDLGLEQQFVIPEPEIAARFTDARSFGYRVALENGLNTIAVLSGNEAGVPSRAATARQRDPVEDFPGRPWWCDSPDRRNVVLDGLILTINGSPGTLNSACYSRISRNVLRFTEVMVDGPALADGNERWFEVTNASARDINLLGVDIRIYGDCFTVVLNSTFRISSDLIVPGFGRALVTNSTANVGVERTYVTPLPWSTTAGALLLTSAEDPGPPTAFIRWGDALQCLPSVPGVSIEVRDESAGIPFLAAGFCYSAGTYGEPPEGASPRGTPRLPPQCE